MRFLYTFLLFIANCCIAVDAKKVDFCKIKCGDKKHTLCQLKHNCDPGPKCKKYDKVLLSKEEQDALVKKHNELRNIVALGQESRGNQPSAANMLEMVWDNEIAFIAQCYANQCQFAHDECRSDSDGNMVGQNLGTISGTDTKSLEQSIQRMYDEVANFDATGVDKFPLTNFENVGHYTQIVWAKSKRLGCGRSKYEIQQNKPEILLVCNYEIGGNMLGDAIYKKGTPASSCPADSKPHATFKGLCTTPPSKSEEPEISSGGKTKGTARSGSGSGILNFTLLYFIISSITVSFYVCILLF